MQVQRDEGHVGTQGRCWGTREDGQTWAQRASRGATRTEGWAAHQPWRPGIWEEPPESLTLASWLLAPSVRSSSQGNPGPSPPSPWSPSPPSPKDCPQPQMGLLLCSLQPLPRAAPRGSQPRSTALLPPPPGPSPGAACPPGGPFTEAASGLAQSGTPPSPASPSLALHGACSLSVL